jgi:type I restriction-modification system DNA methylase subunit
MLPKNLNYLYNELGYIDSSKFIRLSSKSSIEFDFVHFFERAKKDCGLDGVYSCLSKNSTDSFSSTPSIPVVYICETDSEEKAQEIHKKVWNQNLVPFLIIASPEYVRIYNGFSFDQNKTTPLESVSWDEVGQKLQDISSKAIDSGAIWKSPLWEKGPSDQSQRLDARLLDNLNTLGNELVNSKKLEPDVAHGLIGKYIYLRYLRDRHFLSDELLSKWEIKPDDVFTRQATLKAFRQLNEKLQNKLNGSIFPLTKEFKQNKEVFKEEHIQYVAGTFFGDNPTTGDSVLFNLYDFAFIPTELLSTIYEQFLHRNAKGKEKGAYYTPVTLVNFVLNELERKKPLTEKMKVLDPACGSGAFLVQTYRHLIQKKQNDCKGSNSLKPEELKKLLTENIFGIDSDRNACRVAQLGLLLTLLDHLTPSILSDNNQFLLPKLDNNIVEADTFDESNKILQQLQEKKFDWIIGNPPWKQLGKRAEKDQKKSFALKWIEANKKECPVSNSLAEVFVWRSLDFAQNDAALGLLMPAMSLFNMRNKSRLFRQYFFKKCNVWTIANFANLRHHLFAKAIAPCAIFFFHPNHAVTSQSTIVTYSPLRINQTINREKNKGNKNGLWNIIVNTSEIRHVCIEDAITGDPLVWKTAMWGSHRDLSFLQKISRRFNSFENFANQNKISFNEGRTPQKQSKTNSEYITEFSGKNKIIMEKFRKKERTFTFSNDHLETVDEYSCYLRPRDKTKWLEINKPPHIFVDVSRKVAIYSDDYFIVPSRELGIAGEDSILLKALALYFCSDFFRYHQFFLSPEWGIFKGITILDTLKQLPITPDFGKHAQELATIYEQLQKNATSKKYSPEKQNELLQEANKRINKILGLRNAELLLISDFLEYKIRAIDGMIDQRLIRSCDADWLKSYSETLEKSMNNFFDENDGIRHRVVVLDEQTLPNNNMRGIRIDSFRDNEKVTPSQIKLPENIKDILRYEYSQWLYFQRELRYYDKRSIFLFKPNEKLHWLRSQALIDSDNIIGEILSVKGD